ncbi:hypothetical protein ACQP2F_14755 [Actinoplanes sp. CA-030573]|uniref:hypothetical protein n=1 Tax=Actinoplanes sp. CA-030573 TaxID=3239898 RepID=UPI003D948013
MSRDDPQPFPHRMAAKVSGIRFRLGLRSCTDKSIVPEPVQSPDDARGSRIDPSHHARDLRELFGVGQQDGGLPGTAPPALTRTVCCTPLPASAASRLTDVKLRLMVANAGPSNH